MPRARRSPTPAGLATRVSPALRDFVEGGGTLLTFERADALAIERLDVPVRDALQGLDSQEFFYSASLVNVDVDVAHPLGWGMSPRATGFFGGGRAYEPSDWRAANDSIRVVANYPSDDRVLASGLMVGDEQLAGRGAVLEARVGAGRVVLYGFRVQHRAQTRGTFKLVFNALYTHDE